MDLHFILLDMSVDSLVRERSARVALIAGTESSRRSQTRARVGRVRLRSLAVSGPVWHNYVEVGMTA